MDTNYQFIMGDKGKNWLFFEGFLYTKRKSYKISTYWHCIRGCPVIVTMRNLAITGCRDKKFHLHEEDILQMKILDFEKAAISAIQCIFPLSSIKFCYFHFSQSIWRKMQKLGISKSYYDNYEIQRWIKLILTLPLVPPYYLDDAWILIASMTLNTTPIIKMMDYLLNTYMDDTNAMFPRFVISIIITKFLSFFLWELYDTLYFDT